MVILALLAHAQEPADAAAQVQTPGIFTDDVIIPVPLLDRQEPFANEIHFTYINMIFKFLNLSNKPKEILLILSKIL
jgi:hypothetical protein